MQMKSYADVKKKKKRIVGVQLSFDFPEKLGIVRRFGFALTGRIIIAEMTEVPALLQIIVQTDQWHGASLRLLPHSAPSNYW